MKSQQSIALIICFMTELWERYGFYLLQGMLLLYLVRYLDLGASRGYGLTGTFIGLVYTTSIVGGIVADRFLGHFRSVLLGELFLFAGFMMLGSTAGAKIYLLFISLSFIAVGTGLVKSNVAAFLGYFYGPKSSKRDMSYAVFYVGINVGALFGVLFSGFGQLWFGWRIPFFTASLGAAIAFSTLLIGVIFYKLDFEKDKNKIRLRCYFYAIVVTGLCIILCYYIFYYSYLSNLLFIVISVALVFVLLVHMKRYHSKRLEIMAFLILLITSVVFWTMFNQMYIYLTLLVSNIVDHHIFGFYIPTPSFFMFENIGAILLGVFIGKIWTSRVKANKPVHDFTKFTIGLMFMCAAYVLLASSVSLSTHVALMPGYVIVLFCLLVAVSDLSLSPVGLSASLKLAPSNFRGLYMGMWLISMGIGGKLAGELSSALKLPEAEIGLTKMFSLYSYGLWVLVSIMVVIIILLLLINPMMKRFIPS